MTTRDEGGRGRRRRVHAQGGQRREHDNDPEQRDGDATSEREHGRRPAVRELRAMAPLDGLRPARRRSARGRGPRGPPRNSQRAAPLPAAMNDTSRTASAHDGADPAEEVESGDAAALEAEGRGGRTGVVRGIGRRTLVRRLGQGSGYEPGALRGVLRRLARAATRARCPARGSQRRGRRPGRVERLRDLGGDRVIGREVGTLEVLAAPGAQRPVEADEASAVRADAVEPRAAGRADDPFVVHAPRQAGTS